MLDCSCSIGFPKHYCLTDHCQRATWFWWWTSFLTWNWVSNFNFIFFPLKTYVSNAATMLHCPQKAKQTEEIVCISISRCLIESSVLMCVFDTSPVCSTNQSLSHTFVFLWKISELIKPYLCTFRHMTYLIVFIFLYLVMNDANNNSDRGICFCVYQIHWCRWLEPVATILLFCRVSEEPYRRPSYDLAHRWPWLLCSLCILLWKRYLSFFLYVLNLISFRWMLEIVLTILF